MKAREVRELLNGKCEREVMYCIEALAERQSVLQQQIMELASQMDMMVSIINQLTQVGAEMKNAVDAMKGIDPEDDLPPVTQ